MHQIPAAVLYRVADNEHLVLPEHRGMGAVRAKISLNRLLGEFG
jgi:hypothetical protein